MSDHKLTGSVETTELKASVISGLTTFPGGIIDGANKISLSETLNLNKKLNFPNINGTIQSQGSDRITFGDTRIDIKNTEVRIDQNKYLWFGASTRMYAVGTILATFISGSEVSRYTTSGLAVTGNISATGNVSCDTISCHTPPWIATETDPVYTSSPASSITGPMITGWNTAVGWGDHGEAGYLKPLSNTLNIPAQTTITGGYGLSANYLYSNTTITGQELIISSSAAINGITLISSLGVSGNSVFGTDINSKVELGKGTNCLIGFYGATAQTRQTVTGATMTDKFNSLVSILTNMGLINS